MHLRLAAQAVDRLHEGLAIGPYGAAQGFVGIEDGAETERQNGEGAKAFADHAGVIDDGLLGKGVGRRNSR